MSNIKLQSNPMNNKELIEEDPNTYIQSSNPIKSFYG